MMRIKERDKDKVAIVVVGYNRIRPIQRLLKSLLIAKYDIEGVPLVISIDCSGDEELYEYVKSFQWPYGNKYINIQQERLGLRNHIIQCGDLTEQFRAIILLEDDIFVGEYFYDYTLQTIEVYEDEDRIAGISLFNKEIGAPSVPVYYCNNGSDTFLRQSPESWGECWTKKQWAGFKEWYDRFRDEDFNQIDMPEMMKKWTKAWTKYYMAYLIETRRYFVYPYISLTTCFGDPGEHFDISTSLGQTSFLEGRKEYHFLPFDKMVKYDIYCTNEDIYRWLGMGKDELCVDWYGLSENKQGCRYVLSLQKLPCKILKSYGLFMRPVELNVKYNIDGEGIFLYDTHMKNVWDKKKYSPISFVSYFDNSAIMSLPSWGGGIY